MPTSAAHLDALKRNAVFGRLSDTALLRIARLGRNRQFQRGTTLCWRGDPGDSMMAILSGRVMISNTTKAGREIGLNVLGGGDIVGEIAVLDGGERTAKVTALEDCEVFEISRRELLPVLKDETDAMFQVVLALCTKIRVATSIIEDNALEMRARLARGLLRLAEQHGVKALDGIRIGVRLSQSEIGNYVGLSRENVSRQLKMLKTAGLIETQGAHLVIVNEGGLVDLIDASE